MVAQYPPDRMVSKMMPGTVPARVTQEVPGSVPASPAAFSIVIGGRSGDPILKLTERDGRLCAEFDESRADEAVKRFVHEMLRWSGQVGIRWKDEARRAVEGP